MGQFAAERPELMALKLPRRGLGELLRGWTSDGQVFAALSAVSSDGLDIEWSVRDIERRASRVLLERIEGDLDRLPIDANTWLENLPVTTASTRQLWDRPLHPTDWAATARRYGWPPTAFIGRPRYRERDETTVQVLTWTTQKLEAILRDVRPVAKLLSERVGGQIAVLVEVVQNLPETEVLRPDRLDIRALGSSGTPWSSLATVAESLLRAETDLEFLAYEIIEPLPELDWRLFHLSVLGELLAALRDLGARVRWNAPLSASESSGPQFHVAIGHDTWDLWFEASGASRHYRLVSPYRTSTKGLVSAQRTIGADIMLCLPGKRALMLECKWSADGAYVGRDGYHQASSYLIEARSGMADDAWSYVIGPEEIVPTQSEAKLTWPSGAAVVGAGNIRHVAELVRCVVAG